MAKRRKKAAKKKKKLEVLLPRSSDFKRFEDCVIRAGARDGVTSAMRLFRGAPVPMTKEGVGETSSLADALYFFAVRFCARLACRLKALVASAPILRPLHSLLDYAGGLGFFPIGGASARSRRAKPA